MGKLQNQWVFPEIGVYTPKWMVKIMENPIKMDDLGGKPTIFWKHPYQYEPMIYHVTMGCHAELNTHEGEGWVPFMKNWNRFIYRTGKTRGFCGKPQKNHTKDPQVLKFNMIFGEKKLTSEFPKSYRNETSNGFQLDFENLNGKQKRVLATLKQTSLQSCHNRQIIPVPLHPV